MEDVERWWNGAWGRLARRDVWLRTDGERWEVEALAGGVEGHSHTWEFFCEPDARAHLRRLLDDGRGGWRRLTTGAWARRDRKDDDQPGR